MISRISGAAIAAITLLALPAAAQDGDLESLANQGSAFVKGKTGGAWHAEVERTERGFRIGNPDADAALIEFISYTCPACGRFAQNGEGALDMTVLAPGEATVEIRPVIRNAIDLTVSLLVQCGGADGFKDRHRLFMLQQDSWMAKVRAAPQAQQATWARGDRASRVNAAYALDFDDLLEPFGMTKPQMDQCLNDDQAALALIRNGNANREELGVKSTPSFALDGKLLQDVHDWNALYPVLVAQFSPTPEQE